MDDKSIIDALGEEWKTVPQIRSKIVGKSGQAHDLTRALRRLSDAGHIEKRAQSTPAPRRQRGRMGSARVIEFFRAKLGESDR
jgi:predicted DNA-binding ArsR family transcriptional regulator